MRGPYILEWIIDFEAKIFSWILILVFKKIHGFVIIYYKNIRPAPKVPRALSAFPIEGEMIINRHHEPSVKRFSGARYLIRLEVPVMRNQNFISSIRHYFVLYVSLTRSSLITCTIQYAHALGRSPAC